MARAVVKPAMFREHSPMLQTTVVKSYGFRARCDCGWRGPTREVFSEARDDARLHNRAEHK